MPAVGGSAGYGSKSIAPSADTNKANHSQTDQREGGRLGNRGQREIVNHDSLAAAGWDLLTPLFGSDTARLARDMQAAGLRAHLCCVDTQQLDARFAGQAFDAALLDALPAGVDPCGENGEFHTCVSDGPMFAAPLAVLFDTSTVMQSVIVISVVRYG